MKIQRCKGMRDLSPEEMKIFRLVEGVCLDSCTSWGYREVRTPTIEYLHLFTSAGTLTPGRLGKVYSFLDWDGWSGERVVLKPDGTIPVARYYTENLQKQSTARLFYATNLFIFEEDGEKTRERWQCGAELIGASSAMADVELISLSLEILSKLGLGGVQLQLSHAGLIRSLLAKLGLTPEEQSRLFDEILDGNTETLERVSRKSPELEHVLVPLLGLKGQTSGFLKNQKALLARTVPEIRTSLDNFLETVSLLDELGIKYQINVASGAGFEYYTGIIFQMFAGREKVAGGGRYDALIPSMGGGNVPASGFAIYLDRLLNLVKPDTISKKRSACISIKVASDSPKAVREALAVAGELRQAGYITELDLDGKGSMSSWTVEVGRKTSELLLVDNKKSKRTSCNNVEALVKYLEGQNAS
jgi:histidyl-tRNA synthetase